MPIDKKSKAEKLPRVEIVNIKPLKAAGSRGKSIKNIVKSPKRKPSMHNVEESIPVGGSSQTSYRGYAASSSTPSAISSPPPALSRVSIVTPALYASTRLATYETSIDDVYCPVEIFIDDVVYRRVDAHYYAYLAENLDQVTEAYKKGNLPAQALAMTLTKFVKIERWVLESIGHEKIQAAIEERKRNGGYRPEPRQRTGEARDDYHLVVAVNKPGHLFPKDGPWRFTHPVNQASIDKVDRIRYLAMALGWTEAELYQNRGMFKFPMGPGWGLVCFVAGKEIGKIGDSQIELIGESPKKTILRFRIS